MGHLCGLVVLHFAVLFELDVFLTRFGFARIVEALVQIWQQQQQQKSISNETLEHENVIEMNCERTFKQGHAVNAQAYVEHFFGHLGAVVEHVEALLELAGHQVNVADEHVRVGLDAGQVLGVGEQNSLAQRFDCLRVVVTATAAAHELHRLEIVSERSERRVLRLYLLRQDVLDVGEHLRLGCGGGGCSRRRCCRRRHVAQRQIHSVVLPQVGVACRLNRMLEVSERGLAVVHRERVDAEETVQLGHVLVEQAVVVRAELKEVAELTQGLAPLAHSQAAAHLTLDEHEAQPVGDRRRVSVDVVKRRQRRRRLGGEHVLLGLELVDVDESLVDQLGRLVQAARLHRVHHGEQIDERVEVIVVQPREVLQRLL